VPPSHARALDPENSLVVGIRGAGKSFWWSALIDENHRQFVIKAFPETGLPQSVQIGPGYGVGSRPSSFPGKDTIENLTASFDPRLIWKAVVAVHLKFPDPFPREQWVNRVSWVKDNPENYEIFLAAADQDLSKKGSTYIILFDALDRLAKNWASIRPIAKALFQVALDMKGLRAVRLKLFVRPDMADDREIFAFPDASKLLAQKVALNWSRTDLYALLFQCIGNDLSNGEAIRDHMKNHFSLQWQGSSGPGNYWILPNLLRSDEGKQKELFHAICGPAMASGESGYKRGFPYTWLPNHLADGRGQVSPRSFAAALRTAAEKELPENWPYPLHYKGLQSGVQSASKIRVDEIREDFPWVNDVMSPLQRISVPCLPDDFSKRWKNDNTVAKLLQAAEAIDELPPFPPQHLDEGEDGLLKDLQSFDLIQVLADGRIQMPDVYRIAFRLGRKGGVKPVR